MTRKRDEINQRRAAVADRYLRGETQQLIADELSVGVATVARDLAALREQWQQSGLRDFDAAKAEQLAKLDKAESELWEQWRAGAEADGSNADPRYMDKILSVIERRCRLMGLDAPKRAEVSGPNGGELSPGGVGLAAFLAEVQQTHSYDT